MVDVALSLGIIVFGFRCDIPSSNQQGGLGASVALQATVDEYLGISATPRRAAALKHRPVVRHHHASRPVNSVLPGSARQKLRRKIAYCTGGLDITLLLKAFIASVRRPEPHCPTYGPVSAATMVVPQSPDPPGEVQAQVIDGRRSLARGTSRGCSINPKQNQPQRAVPWYDDVPIQKSTSGCRDLAVGGCALVDVVDASTRLSRQLERVRRREIVLPPSSDRARDGAPEVTSCVGVA